MPAADDGPFATFVDRLIGVLNALAPDADARDTDIFRGKLETYRASCAIRPGAWRSRGSPRPVSSPAEQYLGDGAQVPQRSRDGAAGAHRHPRDAAKLSIGDATDFNARMLATSERFGSLAHLEDVRELKRTLVIEVATLRQAVEEKQQRDERAYSQLTARVESLPGPAVAGGRGSLARSADADREPGPLPADAAAHRGRGPRFRQPLALAMLDIDHFKVDQRHAPPSDRRPRAALHGAVLTEGLRQTDFVARYGGEEFAVLLDHASAGQVEDRMRHLLANVAASDYEYELLGKKERVHFTLSCGLTDLQPNDSEEDLIRRADEALYEAKRKGRNGVIARKRSTLKSLLSWG